MNFLRSLWSHSTSGPSVASCSAHHRVSLPEPTGWGLWLLPPLQSMDEIFFCEFNYWMTAELAVTLSLNSALGQTLSGFLEQPNLGQTMWSGSPCASSERQYFPPYILSFYPSFPFPLVSLPWDCTFNKKWTFTPCLRFIFKRGCIKTKAVAKGDERLNKCMHGEHFSLPLALCQDPTDYHYGCSYNCYFCRWPYLGF